MCNVGGGWFCWGKGREHTHGVAAGAGSVCGSRRAAACTKAIHTPLLLRATCASHPHTASCHSTMRRDHAQVPVVLLDNCLIFPHCFTPIGAQQHVTRQCPQPTCLAHMSFAPHIPTSTLRHTHRCTAACTETCVPICLAKSWGTPTSRLRLRCWDTGGDGQERRKGRYGGLGRGDRGRHACGA